MKVLLVALNARYSHTNLAVRLLCKYCKGPDIDIDFVEYTINDNEEYILEHIAQAGADVIGFSCYIWNIGMVLNICENLKKVNREIIIVLGGPEVSYDAKDLLSDCDFIDYIVIGEGEDSFKDLLTALQNKRIANVGGIAYRDSGNVIINQRDTFVSMDDLSFPYDIDIDYSNRYIYYETSRGCPFGCKYCLSSRDRVVRFSSIEKVRADLNKISSMNVNIIKLVDRSFDCNIMRAIEIFDIIRQLPGKAIFHCEVNPELITDEFLKALKGIEHRLQFEAGLQTTNPGSLIAVGRNPDASKSLCGIKRLKDAGIRVHADLIAGLPYDTYETFTRAFDGLYRVGPDEIQLGFLKLLKGTALRDMAQEFHMIYRSQPPYELLYNKWMSFDDICRLKGIEFLINRYYNSGKFKYSLDYMVSYFKRPVEFFEEFSRFWRDNGLMGKNHSLKELYRLLYVFVIKLAKEEEVRSLNIVYFMELLKFDYMLNQRNTSLSDFIAYNLDNDERKRIKALLKDKRWLKENLPDMVGKSVGEILKEISFEHFYYDVPISDRKADKYIIFLYSSGNTNVKNKFVEVEVSNCLRN